MTVAGCVSGSAVPGEDTCDPHVLEAGEVRARQVHCGDELIGGGEGRVGDWLIESAAARFVVRGTYGALTELGEEGGTVIDAVGPAGVDVLGEYRPDGDRGRIDAVAGDGWAELVLPGVTYHLDADADAIQVIASGTGRLVGLPGVARTGATLAEGEAFVGVDGSVVDGEGAVRVEGVERLAVSPRGLFPAGADAAGDVDADAVRVDVDGVEVLRVAVTEGVFAAWVPAGADLVGERDGCRYEGLAAVACGSLLVRVEDDAGADLRARVDDGLEAWTLPLGGGVAPVGPDPRDLWVWAGPAFTAAPVRHPGGDATVDVTLHRELSTDGWALADLAAPAAPDGATSRTAAEAATLAAGEGVGFLAAVADDEIPWVWVEDHDDVVAVAASRTAGWLWSWPWSPSGRKPAHGAVSWPGLGALDQLAWSEGGESAARLMVVTAAWVEAALLEAPPADWSPRPDALWLDDPADRDAWFALLNAGVDVAPVADRTWVPYVGARNVPAVEAGIVAGDTSAGTGPRVTMAATRGTRPRVIEVVVTVEAARWAGMRSVTLWSADGEQEAPLAADHTATFRVDEGAAWVVAEATGDAARPWGGGDAWAMAGPLWLGGP